MTDLHRILQQVIDDGWEVGIYPPRDYESGGVSITKPGHVSYWCDWGRGETDAPFDVRTAIRQAWRRWEGR